jgi:hypothetical protein
MYLGNLLHVGGAVVAYFLYWCLIVSSALTLGLLYDFQVSIDFFFNGHARLGSLLLKYEIFRGSKLVVCE